MPRANPQLEDGHSRFSNEWLEALFAWPGPAEVKVFSLVIARETWGWHEKQRAVPLSRLRALLGGLSRSRVCELRSQAAAMNLILVRPGTGGKDYCTYAVQKDYSRWLLPEDVPGGRLKEWSEHWRKACGKPCGEPGDEVENRPPAQDGLDGPNRPVPADSDRPVPADGPYKDERKTLKKPSSSCVREGEGVENPDLAEALGKLYRAVKKPAEVKVLVEKYQRILADPGCPITQADFTWALEREPPWPYQEPAKYVQHVNAMLRRRREDTATEQDQEQEARKARRWAMGYARQLCSDPMWAGNWRQIRRIMCESFPEALALEIVAELEAETE